MSRNIRKYCGFKEWIFALFLLANIFKPNPETNDSSFDLTVFTAAICVILVAWQYFQSRERLFTPVILMLSLFALFVPTLLWTDWNSYAVEKASRFYTLTLLAAIAPIFIVRTADDLRRFLSGFVFLCSIVAGTALVVLLGQGDELDRLAVLDATTIITGRAVGIVILTLGLLWFEPRSKKWLVGTALVILPTVLVATGAKGPLVATPLALGLCLILFKSGIRRYLSRVLIVCVLSAATLWFSLPLLPGTSLFRVGTFVLGQFGTSEEDRTTFFADTMNGIVANPRGLGLGGFASKYGVAGGEIREFPHNILLEVFLEGGWFAGLYFTYLLWRGLKGVYLLGKNGEVAWAYRLLFCFTVFSLLNDLVSGELNDSKVLLAFLGLSIGLAGDSKEKAPAQSGWASSLPKGTLLTQDGSS
jgi:hypothetical protein